MRAFARLHFAAPDVKGSMRRKTPTRIDQMLTLAVLALLIVGCFLVLQPFITAVVWAAILCVTSWPLF
jgi:predicted PurR-regulated permease PerM